MTREVRRNYLRQIENFYKTIRDAASGITDNHEKQKFLKTVYENFYKVYNPKGADKLGVVYTPNEIVRFMIDSTDWLLEKHFGKSLSDKGVDILDPATGTGTFIAELIDRINIHNLEYKYEHELHANEVAILPYYIANLNIEYTYQQRKGSYKEFKNICFVDTLDNIDALHYSGKQLMLGGISSENAKRIKDQNAKRISVIIGNPPYYANQANYNDFNKSREYPEIDRRIKDTFIKFSTARKTRSYDMYSRFYRWSMDRIDKNGILVFVTNNSFIDGRSYDGFRKCVEDEFNDVWIVDLKGDARTSGERRRQEGGNVFDDKIREGISIIFLIKDEQKNHCRIHYNAIGDYVKAIEKRDYLRVNRLNSLSFEHIYPDDNHNWINLSEENIKDEFNKFLPLFQKDKINGLFQLFGNSIKTNRDEWVYDFHFDNLVKKVEFFSNKYHACFEQPKNATQILDTEIKWSEGLKDKLEAGQKFKIEKQKIIHSYWRPFVKKYFYSEKVMNDRLTDNHYKAFGSSLLGENIAINLPDTSVTKPYSILATDTTADYHFLSDTKFVTLYFYEADGKKNENITNWGLEQFQTYYQSSNISKHDIFYYTYAVLHSPVYRKKYEQNLKREFPRLPFYDDFFQWRDWGKELMDLHINYETVEPYQLKEVGADSKPNKKAQQQSLLTGIVETVAEAFTVKPRTKLKADKANGIIEIDTKTQLTGVPPIAWEYKLGNRSALEWILDQYKEKKPQDATIAERFNTYKFEDYKEQVIDLLKRVCTVSVRTMEIINRMPKD